MTTVRQYDYDVRNALISAFIAAIGPAPTLKIRTGSMPSNAFAADTGTLLSSFALPSTWQAAPSLGVSNLSGTWSGTASAGGVAGHFRMFSAGSPNDCKYQGLITQAFSVTTTALSAINSNVLTFSTTSAISVGSTVNATGIPAGTTVLEKTSTTVTLSRALTAEISSSTAIFFGDTSGALWLSNTTIAVSDAVTVTRHRMTAPGA